MVDQIKITTEELQKFNDLKTEIQKTIFEFGELYMEKMELDGLYKSMSEKESEMRKRVVDLKNQESSLMNSILQKYGEGNLNVKEGIFTPSKKIT